MTPVGSLVDLDLTSDDPREFVRELVKLKLALLDAQLAAEVETAGAGSEEAQRLQATRKAFAALGRQSATPAEKAAPREPAPAPARSVSTPVRVAEPVTPARASAAPVPAADAAAPGPGAARRVRRVVISDDSEVAVRPARRAVAVAIVEDGKSATPGPVLATIKKLKARTAEGTLSLESVEQIEKMAQDEGFLDTQEMLWLKRGRLRDQIVKLETAGGDAKQLIYLRKELQSIEYLLAGGLQEAKLLGRQQAAAKQQQSRCQQSTQQEKLKAELTGLLDEIDGQG